MEALYTIQSHTIINPGILGSFTKFMSFNEIRIAGLQGDGIGPEVYPYGLELLRAANQILGQERFAIDTLPYNANYFLEHGRAWPDGTPKDLASKYHGALWAAFGDVRVPRDGMAHAVEILLRGFRGHEAWETNLNKRPGRLLHPSLRPQVEAMRHDFRLFALDSKAVTIHEEERQDGIYPTETHSLNAFRAVLDSASRLAAMKGEQVLVVHKSSVMRNGHGQWKDRVLKPLYAERKDSFVTDMYMDAFLELLVKNPASVPKVLVTDGVFGKVIERILPVLSSGERGVIPEDFDVWIGRENIEGMYFKTNEMPQEVDGDVIGKQIGRHSPEYIKANILGVIDEARKRGLDKITVLHIDDGHPRSYALWKRIALEVTGVHKMHVDFMHAGDFVAELIRNPAAMNHRVFAADNILGDICGDAVAACIGGLGIAATMQINTTGRTGKFAGEPLHGSAPNVAGKGIANPTAMVLTVGELFAQCGNDDLCDAVARAIQNVIARGIRTQDIGGQATTVDFGNTVVREFTQQAQ